MRILLSTIGSHGDVHPFIAIGKALRRRGHDVALLVQPLYRKLTLDAGLEHIPLGDEVIDLSIIAENPRMMDPWRGPPTIVRELILPETPKIFNTVERELTHGGFDALVTHHIAFGAAWAAEKHGVPCAAVGLAPLVWMSRHEPLIGTPITPADPPRWLYRTTHRLIRPMLRKLYDKPINAVRAEFRLPPVRDAFLAETHAGDVTLGLWSTHFRGPLADDPPNSHICGFSWFDAHKDHDHLTPDVESFLNEGEPPILFTLGSTAVFVAGPFYEAAAEACRRLGRRGLLLIGRAEHAPKHLPPGVRTFTYAPHSIVMPRAAANVIHGGVGTTAQALRAGRPMIVVPFAHDQFDNAARAVRLGVSRTVKRSRLSADTMEAALRAVLDSPDVASRARTLGAKIAAEDGAVRAAEIVEQTFAQRRTPEPAAA